MMVNSQHDVMTPVPDEPDEREALTDIHKSCRLGQATPRWLRGAKACTKANSLQHLLGCAVTGLSKTALSRFTGSQAPSGCATSRFMLFW